MLEKNIRRSPSGVKGWHVIAFAAFVALIALMADDTIGTMSAYAPHDLTSEENPHE